MATFRDTALLPTSFVFQHVLPSVWGGGMNPLRMLPATYRRYFIRRDPERDIPVGQISLRVNEVCNLRCRSCGQWGENGHIKQRLERGEKLQRLDLDTVKRIVFETRRDKPFYYVWGGEPTLWKPLVPFFEELARYGLYGSIVTNAQALDPVIEPLLDTNALSILFLSLDGWDADSQNIMRSPASGARSDNFEKTMGVIEKIHALKQKRRVKVPFVIPITVISNENFMHLSDIHRLILDTTQLHPYYFGWFITEQRAAAHELVFEQRFGYNPVNHQGYLKSCFNDVDAATTARQIAEVKQMARGRESVPQFLPDLSTEADIRRYYADHSWDCGFPVCNSIYYVAEISPDGRVTPCRDYQDYTAGNITTQSFYEVWNGPKYKEFRRQMKKGLMPVCTRCCGLQGF